MSKYFMGVDAGTHGVRVGITDDQGQFIACLLYTSYDDMCSACLFYDTGACILLWWFSSKKKCL